MCITSTARTHWRAPGGRSVRARLLIVHGYGEHHGRYAAFARFLARSGIAVWAYDLPGHGAHRGRPGHVRRFCDYVRQFDRLALAAWAEPGPPRFLFAHSLGGLIALTRVCDPTRPVVGAGAPLPIAGLIVSAPFLAFAEPPPRGRAAFARLLGLAWPSAPIPKNFDNRKLSTDPREVARADADPLQTRVATPRWLAETLRAQARLRRRLVHYPAALPLLAFAGDADRVADTRVFRRLVAACPSTDLTARVFAGMRHELLHEREPERAATQNLVRTWVLARA